MTRVFLFLSSLLVFLGFDASPDRSAASMLETLESWLEGAKKIRRDPQGATARIWWDMFKAVMLESRGRLEYAAQIADEAIDEFGKRFLPVAEDERDTLNTGDLDAMRAELDEADRYRQEICDALDGVTAPRAFVHSQIVDELRAEREVLLAANKHHASEIETLRSQRRKDLAEMAQLANALDGVRAAILAPSLPDGEVPDVIRAIVAERNVLHVAICNAVGMRIDIQFDRVAAVTALRTDRDALRAANQQHASEIEQLRNQRDIAKRDAAEWETKALAKATQCGELVAERDALKSQLAGAIVPLPKPASFEVGQKWAFVTTCTIAAGGQGYNDFEFPTGDNLTLSDTEVLRGVAYYLGTEK